MSRNAIRLCSFGVIAALYLGSYSRSLDYAFVWDDATNIKSNASLSASLWEALSATEHEHMDAHALKLKGLRPSHDSYRPLQHISYQLNIALTGMNPAGLRIHDLAVGLLSIFLVFGITRRFLESEKASLLATAVFAIHPLAVEPIVYVSGRADILAGFFALLCVWSAFRFSELEYDVSSRRYLWLALAALGFLASLLCKEASMGLPLALALLVLSLGEFRKHRITLLALSITLIAYLAFRIAIAGSGGASHSTAGIIALPAIWLDLLLASWLPTDLSNARPYNSAFVLPGWLLLLGVGIFWLRRLQKPQPDLLRIALGGLLWMPIMIGPSAVVTVISKEIADRYAYLPLLGFVVASVALGLWFCQQHRAGRIIMIVTAFVWCALLMLVNWRQVPTWKNDEVLYAHALRVEPESSKAHYRLAVIFTREKNWEVAIPLLNRAVQLDPSNVRAWNNLGVSLMESGRLSLAKSALQKAIHVKGAQQPRTWYNLGVVHLRLGERPQGCLALQRALERDPAYENALSLRDQVCTQPGSTTTGSP